MTIDLVAAWMTVVTAPVAVAGVALVWLQLRRMQADALGAQRRRAAAILPLVDGLRSRIEGDWGCDIIDRPQPVPDDEFLSRLKSYVDADIRFSEDLRTRCADAGLQQVVLASMIETDLKVCSYYLRAVERSTDRKDQWALRWPELVKQIHRLWELAHRLEASFSEEEELAPAERQVYRAKLSEELNAAIKSRLANSLTERRVLWPPDAPLLPSLPNKRLELAGAAK